MNKSLVYGKVIALKKIYSEKTKKHGVNFILKQEKNGTLVCSCWNQGVVENIKENQIIELIHYDLKNIKYKDKNGNDVWKLFLDLHEINLLRESESGFNDLSKSVKNTFLDKVINNQFENKNHQINNVDLELVNLFDDEENMIN